MRVVFADHVANDACRFHRLGASHQPEFTHGKKHTALHWLLAVLHVRQGATFDHGNGVFKVITRGGFVQQNALAVVFFRCVRQSGRWRRCWR